MLIRRGYRVFHYPSLGRFFDSLRRRLYEVLLMDMHLPGMAGREILRALRANPETRGMVLIGLSSRPRSKDEVAAAFSAGADEYFIKPLDLEMLVVRLQSLLRRLPTQAASVGLRHGAITIYPESHVCRVDDKGVRLTRLEFDLLLEFIRNPNRVLTRGNLIDTLWRGDGSRGMRSVDRHVHALRSKLGVCGRLLKTLVGVGYQLSNGASGNSK
ncbi:MAG: hypothetical protein A3J74_09895 [Elusimicrobia bacterium RIFCSPHIGHO2_02_FULL_57_9]|nr:MAG: hypothetical protein A3J74_09895 [Elusimicrobia bacterium RIFCSPHIGHO2_02_FULL_57_9]